MSVVLNGSSQWLNLASSLGGSGDLTVSAWFKADDVLANYAIFAQEVGVSDINWAVQALLQVSGGVAGDPAAAGQYHFGVGWGSASSTTASTAGTWYNIIGVFPTRVGTQWTSRTVYLNGSGSATNTTAMSWLAPDKIFVGVLCNWNKQNYFKGKISQVAMWNRQLSASDISQLANYTSPLNIQPANLLAYWPLLSDANDDVGSNNLTENGTPTYSTDEPASPSGMVERYTRKKLVAIGNNEVWYKSGGNSFTKIIDSVATLNTLNPLTAASAFQKRFIANGSNLKVVDFINTRISTANVGAGFSVAPDKGTVLTGGTSSAAMVVDYINASSGACKLYGYKTTTASFVSGETVTGSNGDGGAVSFAVASAQGSAPNYYSWTTYAAFSDYGTMPTQATLTCRYRGRMVLAGWDSYPHQYWMSRVGDPWDWAVAEDDELSPVIGNNSDAGELGDIILALIPYGDDYLLFGCSHSIHLMTGDPASGGRVDEIADDIGIVGPRAWCKDSMGNLYFVSESGFYKMDSPRSKPVPISASYLPKMMSDLAYDPTLHRMVLVFDQDHQAVIINRTTLDTGVNTGYWYSLLTERFYPIQFPDVCGIFCGMYYPSTDDELRATVFGCQDGYTRELLDTAKNDDIGATDQAISAYVGWVEPIGDKEDREGKLTSLTIELAGGSASGAYTDTDSAGYQIYTAETAEDCMERMKDGDTAALSAMISGPGRKARIREKIRGAYLGFKIRSVASSTSWALNHINGDFKTVGRIQ